LPLPVFSPSLRDLLWDAAHMRTSRGYARIGPATVSEGRRLRADRACHLDGLRGLARRVSGARETGNRPSSGIIGGLAAQMLLLKVAGFSIATGLLFAATAVVSARASCGSRSPIGIVLSFVVWAIFRQLLQLSLPAGPLEHLFF
jgi:putative tricarboxylic transport membrane protein